MTAAAKKAVRKGMRSGTYECQVCREHRRLVEHHVHGRDASSQTIWICPSCHDDIHAGAVIVEGVFLTTTGWEVVWRREGEPPKVAEGASPKKYR